MKKKLSKRELEVINLVSLGLENKEIGSKLGIKEHTVKNHLTYIYQKLEASNRAQAIAITIRSGLI